MFNITTFDSHDLLSLIIILLYFVFSVLAYYVPLYVIFRDKKKINKIIIPMAIALQIIFGYIFYLFQITKFYPAAYLIFIATLNSASIWILKREIVKLFNFSALKLKKICWLLLISIPIIFSRFYDAVAFNAPGNPDALAHLTMLKELIAQGYLGNSYYAPGFHLFLLPLTHLISTWDISRFTGPFLGLFSVLTVYLLFKDSFKNKLTAIFLVSVLCLPIFSRFGLQTIGFFPSALTFIFLPFFIYLITAPKAFGQKTSIILSLLASVALSVTVPYLFVQLIPGAILIYLIMVIFRARFEDLYQKFLLKYILVLLIGFIVAFGHVYLFTKTIHRQGGFPEIPTIALTTEKPITGNNYLDIYKLESFTKKYENRTEIYFRIPVHFVKSDFYQSMLAPMISTGVETLKIKNVLGFDNFLQTGAWVYLLVFAGLIYYSIKTKNKILFAVSVIGLVFGISTQTGIIEMSYYRGRSGWYYNMLMLISLPFLFDILYKEKLQRYAIILIGFLGLYVIFKPLIFPRLFYPETYAFASQISKSSKSQKNEIITSESPIYLTSDRLIIKKLKVGNLQKSENEQYLILNKKPLDRVALLSTMIFSPEKDITLADQATTEKNKTSEINLVLDIKNSDYFKNYSLFSETENIEIYKLRTD